MQHCAFMNCVKEIRNVNSSKQREITVTHRKLKNNFTEDKTSTVCVKVLMIIGKYLLESESSERIKIMYV